jgi:hypothetical protein
MSDGDDLESDGVLKWKSVDLTYEPTRLAERPKASEDESVTQFAGCAPSSNNAETRTGYSKSKLNVFVLFWSSVVLQTFAAATYASAHIHNRARVDSGWLQTFPRHFICKLSCPPWCLKVNRLRTVVQQMRDQSCPCQPYSFKYYNFGLDTMGHLWHHWWENPCYFSKIKPLTRPEGIFIHMIIVPVINTYIVFYWRFEKNKSVVDSEKLK